MTVRELRDKLDHYIKTDPPDQWQLNDVKLDAQAYEERCKERENVSVVIVKDSMKPTYNDIVMCCGLMLNNETTDNLLTPYENQQVYGLIY